MYRCFSFTPNKSQTSKDIHKACVVDQTPCKEFMLSDTGWPRNNISQLAHASTMAEYEAIVRNMQLQQPQFNLKDDFDKDAAFAMIKPRWCQMPNELNDFAKVLADHDMDYVLKEQDRIDMEEYNSIINESTPKSEQLMKRLLLFYFFYALAVVLDYCTGNVQDYSQNLALFGLDDALAAGLIVGGAGLIGSTISGLVGSLASLALETRMRLQNFAITSQLTS